MNLRFVAPAAILFSVAAFSQTTPPTSDGPFQVKYISNLAIGDSVVNLSNSGAGSTATSSGNICVNVYAFSPDEQEISCCSCFLTPNALFSLSARNDLISNTLTPAVPTSIVVKLVATAASDITSGTTGGVNSCNAATGGTGVAGAQPLAAAGLLAWGTAIHALPAPPASPAAGLYGVTETAFTPATLSATELARITALCGFIQSNGSTFGVCRACRFGGLGAERQ